MIYKTEENTTLELHETLSRVLLFTHQMNGIKNLIRFRGMPGWQDMEPERWDSVAEHSWRMALLAVMLSSHISEKIDLLKTLKMVLVHDIVEMVGKYFSPIASHSEGGGHAFSHAAFDEKYRREIAASEKVFIELPDEMRLEFQELFKEYITTKAVPESATPEGRFAYALDKIEAAIQIIDWRAPTKSWQKEYYDKSMRYIFEWSQYDPALKRFCELIKKEGELIVRAG